MSLSKTPANAISTACVQIHREYTGRGPTEAKATILPDALVVALGGVLTTAERNLVSVGMSDQVRDIRDRLQTAMREDLVAAAEQALGRGVLALLSTTDVHRDLGIQVFTLAPASRS